MANDELGWPGHSSNPICNCFNGIFILFSQQNNWSLGLPLIVMGLVPLISGLLSLLLPETKGKSLSDTLHELRHAALL